MAEPLHFRVGISGMKKVPQPDVVLIMRFDLRELHMCAAGRLQAKLSFRDVTAVSPKGREALAVTARGEKLTFTLAHNKDRDDFGRLLRFSTCDKATPHDKAFGYPEFVEHFEEQASLSRGGAPATSGQILVTEHRLIFFKTPPKHHTDIPLDVVSLTGARVKEAGADIQILVPGQDAVTLGCAKPIKAMLLRVLQQSVSEANDRRTLPLPPSMDDFDEDEDANEEDDEEVMGPPSEDDGDSSPPPPPPAPVSSDDEEDGPPPPPMPESDDEVMSPPSRRPPGDHRRSASSFIMPSSATVGGSGRAGSSVFSGRGPPPHVLSHRRGHSRNSSEISLPGPVDTSSDDDSDDDQDAIGARLARERAERDRKIQEEQAKAESDRREQARRLQERQRLEREARAVKEREETERLAREEAERQRQAEERLLKAKKAEEERRQQRRAIEQKEEQERMRRQQEAERARQEVERKQAESQNKHQQELDRLRQQLQNEAAESNQVLNNLLALKEEEARGLNKLAASRLEETAAARNQIRSLEERLRKEKAQVEEQAAQASELRTQLELSKEETIGLKGRQVQLEKEKSQARDEASKASESLRLRQIDLETALEQIASLKKQLSGAEQDFKQLRDSLKQTNKELEAKVETLETQLRESERKAGELREDHAIAIARLEADLSAARKGTEEAKKAAEAKLRAAEEERERMRKEREEAERLLQQEKLEKEQAAADAKASKAAEKEDKLKLAGFGLPAGWIAKLHKDGRVFYVQVTTKKTSWKRPTAGLAASSAGAVDQPSFMLSMTSSSSSSGSGGAPSKSVIRASSGTRLPNLSIVGEESDSLPLGWTQHTAKDSGKVYYVHKASKKTSWKRPVADKPTSAAVAEGKDDEEQPLPPGWTQHTAKDTGKVYYAHKASKKTSWKRPVAETPAAPSPAKAETGGAKKLLDLRVSVPDNVEPESQKEEQALPEGWVAKTHADGRTYYVNAQTRKSSWVRPDAKGDVKGHSRTPSLPQVAPPVGLPAGWIEKQAPDGRAYYVNVKTKERSWKPPQ